MMQQDPLISEVEDYCAKAGISPSTFGIRAVGNSRFLDRLKRKSDEAQRVKDKVRTYMAAHPPTAKADGAAA